MTQEFWNTLSGLGTEEDATVALIRHVARRKRESNVKRAGTQVKRPALTLAE